MTRTTSGRATAPLILVDVNLLVDATMVSARDHEAWIPEPGPRHLDVLDALLRPQPSVRLVTDAHLAAIAIEHGLELSSRDRDFARWSDLALRSSDPLA